MCGEGEEGGSIRGRRRAAAVAAGGVREQGTFLAAIVLEHVFLPRE